jgi:RNA polymerase sigma-70 factor, ECF subfamily
VIPLKQPTIVRKAQAGDVEAFLQLLEPVERKVYAVAFALTRSQLEAEQVAAEAITSLFVRFPSYQGRGSVEQWMVRTAVSEVLRQVRERRVARAG